MSDPISGISGTTKAVVAIANCWIGRMAEEVAETVADGVLDVVADEVIFVVIDGVLFVVIDEVVFVVIGGVIIVVIDEVVFLVIYEVILVVIDGVISCVFTIFSVDIVSEGIKSVLLETERVKCFFGKGGGLFSLDKRNRVSSSEFTVSNCESITLGFFANGLISDINYLGIVNRSYEKMTKT